MQPKRAKSREEEMYDEGIEVGRAEGRARIAELEAEIERLKSEHAAAVNRAYWGQGWDRRSRSDKPLPEGAEIKAAHPLRTGNHKRYDRARELVSARHSKYELVDLVNWLLAKAEER